METNRQSVCQASLAWRRGGAAAWRRVLLAWLALAAGVVGTERGAMRERPNKNVARGEATRAQLIAIATRMFAERGYEDTSIEAVLREAGVSRGSLYHH